MGYIVLKLAITAVLVVAISEVARRSTLLGGVLASLPLVSVLAMTWLYVDTKNVEKVASLATSILWLIVPSLTLFVLLPILLRRGVAFFVALGTSIVVMVGAYLITVGIARRFGVTL